jgi:ankyrin repeat protein
MGVSVALRRIGGRRDERGVRDVVPETDLHTAVRNGDRVTVRRRLAFGASPVSLDPSGFTPLHIAAFGGHGGILRVLLAAGTPIDVRSVHGRSCTGATALHLAVAAGQTGAAAILLEAGANPSTRDEAGWTALHLAADRGDVEMVRLLLSAKAAVEVWVGDATPLDLARHGRHSAVVGLLRQQGAR